MSFLSPDAPAPAGRAAEFGPEAQRAPLRAERPADVRGGLLMSTAGASPKKRCVHQEFLFPQCGTVAVAAAWQCSAGVELFRLFSAREIRALAIRALAEIRRSRIQGGLSIGPSGPSTGQCSVMVAQNLSGVQVPADGRAHRNSAALVQ